MYISLPTFRENRSDTEQTPPKISSLIRVLPYASFDGFFYCMHSLLKFQFDSVYIMGVFSMHVKKALQRKHLIVKLRFLERGFRFTKWASF